MKTYIKEVDILKGIAIFMVLLGHSFIVYPINLGEILWCDLLHTTVSSVHMPLFFIVSGYCFRCAKYKDYLIKKIKRILIPYFVFSIVSLVCSQLFGSLVNGETGLWDSIIDVFIYGSDYWFLYTLFLIFLFFPFISNVVSRFWGITILILIGIEYIPNIPELFNLDSLVRYLLYFVIGYIIKSKNFMEYFERRFDDKKQSLLCFLALILWTLLVCLNYFAVEDFYVLEVTLVILSAGTGIVFWVLLSKKIKNSKLADFLCEIGKYSLQLYLFNGYMLVVARTLIVKVLGVKNPIIIVVWNMIFTLGISYLINRFIIKKVNLFRCLTGIV